MRLGVFLASGLLGALALARLLPACGGAEFVAASASDAGGSPDAGATPSGSFCALEAGTHTFCDDFDGPPLASKWTSIEQTGGGTIGDDSSQSYSAPSSLATIAPNAVAATQGRVLEVFGAASKVVVAFEMLIDMAPQQKTGVGSVTLGGDSLVAVGIGSNYTVGLSAHANLGYYEDTTTDAGVTQVLSSNDDLVVTPGPTKWTSVVLEVDIAAEQLSITVGGQVLLKSAPISPPTGNVVVNLGAYQRNETATLSAHYDNVTIDITP
jgi:hypothetical protein